MTEANLPSMFRQPPPAGVECDCEYECSCPEPGGDGCDHERGHWHHRRMHAFCDLCGAEVGPVSFNVYTKAGGRAAMAAYVRALGWVTNEDTNVYKCSGCRRSKP